MANVETVIAAFNRRVTQELMPNEVVRLGLDIENRAVRKTPVDTGRLRGAWSSDVMKLPGGEIAVRISNPTEYAIPVEQGTERQRPRRMLARSIAEVSKGL